MCVRLTQRGEAVWWWLVWACGPQGPGALQPACPGLSSEAAPSGRAVLRAPPASGPHLSGCTPALGPLPHSGSPGSPSDRRRCGACCRSPGSGRGAGSQLRGAEREGGREGGKEGGRENIVRVMLEQEGAASDMVDVISEPLQRFNHGTISWLSLLMI